MVVPCRLRVGEGHAERRCNHETHECALDERSPHCRKEEALQIEPDLAVMTRLKDEMTFPLRKELIYPETEATLPRTLPSPTAASFSAASWRSDSLTMAYRR